MMDPIDEGRQIFHDLLRNDVQKTGFVGASTLMFLWGATGEKITWMRLQGIRFDAHVETVKAGDRVAEVLVALGAEMAGVETLSHWYTGETHIVRGFF